VETPNIVIYSTASDKPNNDKMDNLKSRGDKIWLHLVEEPCDELQVKNLFVGPFQRAMQRVDDSGARHMIGSLLIHLP
jgi:hypothetical protein